MKKFKIKNFNRGMTYVELIVVLSIFSIMSTVVLFNHSKFQAKIDVKNLSTDIALKLVEAQKDAIAGVWRPSAPANWTPAYGVYFDTGSYKKNFFYFADFDNDNQYDGSNCSGECLSNIAITKGNEIKTLVVNGSGCSTVTALSAVFTRPDSSAEIRTNQSGCTNISYAEITVSSPNSVTGIIKLHSSGRIEVD